jgi:hypothetical protein
MDTSETRALCNRERRRRDKSLGSRRAPSHKKSAEIRGATLVFPDESGFLLTPTVRRSWAPRGKTPIQRYRFRRGRISAISAITVSPVRQRLGLYFCLLDDNQNVNAEDIVSFLKDLKRYLRRPLAIVWDRGNVHDRSREVQRYLAKHSEIVTEKFPEYVPELNPGEGVWGYIRGHTLCNYA